MASIRAIAVTSNPASVTMATHLFNCSYPCRFSQLLEDSYQNSAM
ncbi:MAG TPA: hypothetical protein V6D50_17170 [Chroococcales cyanobacterium]